MNPKVHIDASILRGIYYKYKEYVVPSIAFILSWFIFAQFALPQIQNFLSEQSIVTADEQTLAILTQNYNTVVSFPNDDLQQLLSTANHALPQAKDFAGILNAISTAAGLSGATVNDYSFQVGNLTGSSGSIPTAGVQTIQLALTLNGTLTEAKAFVHALSEQLPLSEVTSISLSSADTVGITADFYYNPLPQITFVDTTPLPIISASQKKQLESLSTNTVLPLVTPIASSSPQLTPAVVSSSAAK